MVCTPRAKIGLIGGMFFAGWASTLLVLTCLADRYGRQRIWLACISVTALAMIGMYASRSVDLTIALQFVVGAASSGRCQVGFVFANEFLPPKWRLVYSISLSIADGAIAIWLTTYFGWISN